MSMYKFPNIWTSCLYQQRVQTELADSVDPDQIALEQSDQGLHCLPAILLKVRNTLTQKRKVTVQVLNLKTQSRCLLSRKMHAFFFFFFDVPG